MKLTLNFKNQNVIFYFLIRLSHPSKFKAIYFIWCVISPMPSNESHVESIKLLVPFPSLGNNDLTCNNNIHDMGNLYL